MGLNEKEEREKKSVEALLGRSVYPAFPWPVVFW